MTRTEFFAESHCPRCGAETYLALYEKTGNKAHLNREPDNLRGNIVLDKITFKYIILQKPQVQEAIEAGQSLYLNHWATCSAASRPSTMPKMPPRDNVIQFRRRA